MKYGRLFFLFTIVILCSCSGRFFHSVSEEEQPSSLQALLKKPGLKVLDIGNSYSEGSLALLPTVVGACGADVKDMCLYKLVRSGASFKDWCDVSSDRGEHSYSFRRVTGGLSVPVKAESVTESDGTLFRRVLSEVDWDIIIIHQVSSYAPYYEMWRGNGAGGYFDTFLDIIKLYQPKAEIGFMLVHSYWDGFSQNKEKSSLERWKKIAESVRRMQRDYGVRLIIPYGTAVENLRSSSFNNGFDLTKDGSHCGYGLCQYVAACTYYEAVLYPRTGITCYGTDAQIDVSNKNSKYPGVSVNSKNAIVAQRAALMAVRDMYHLNNPER